MLPPVQWKDEMQMHTPYIRTSVHPYINVKRVERVQIRFLASMYSIYLHTRPTSYIYKAYSLLKPQPKSPLYINPAMIYYYSSNAQSCNFKKLKQNFEYLQQLLL